ncbi:MAG TPA: phytanoyl-CoA dioxygenase family protein, partial [Candidatus Acidoferrales bacterium]|nr:phytanoyl-CoA dioxygenase family protein [Candidatus Acidoferrales bacterium]
MLSSQDLNSHLERIKHDGYSIVENAIEPDFVDELAADLSRLERQYNIKPAKNPFEGSKTVRIYNLLVHGKVYERIPIHENVLPVVEGVLDSGCLVSSLSSIAICGGEIAQPIHADDQLIPIPKPHPPTVCNTMWALTDFTEANGATRIIPGTHVSDHSP